jgi:hypothetical protein
VTRIAQRRAIGNGLVTLEMSAAWKRRMPPEVGGGTPLPY